MKKYFFLILILSVVSLFSQTEPTDTDGDGYRNISTLSHLQWLTQNSGSWDENYELDNDIDAYDTRDWNDEAGWLPIGNSETAFTGNFNGNGYTISNLFISRADERNIGFFGVINNTESEISNLHLSSLDYTGDDYIGGIAGNANGCNFLNIAVSGSLSGDDYIGGICGSSDNCLFNIVSGNIDITGDVSLGGIAGELIDGSEIRHSYSEGSIEATGAYSSYIGGLCGRTSGSETLIADCWSSADVSGHSFVGGLIGYHHSTLFRGFSYGTVSGNSSIGGLIGGANGSTYYSYWDTETSGQETSAGGTGKTTSEMKQQSTFSQFNFYNLWEINGDYPEFQDLSSYSQPEEKELSELSGSGTESDPYILTTANEFNAMRHNLSAYYRLGNDIDLSSSLIWNYGRGWEPVGSEDEGNNFSGTLDGYGFTLTGITVNRPLSDEMGLFGYMNGAEIKNISFENTHIAANDYAGTIAGKSENSYFSFINVGANIVIRDDYAGGISGYSTTDLMHYLSAEINVFGESYLGGIAGYFQNGSEIRNSTSKGNVSSWGTHVGGLFGKTYGYETLISDCFSLADVVGYSTVGGLIGDHQTATVFRSFSYGSVSGTAESPVVGGLIASANGTTYYSYWDTETSGQETSAGGTGKTTSEMKLQSTYPQYNFDYLWEMDNSYPDFQDLSIHSQPESVDLSTLIGTGTESDPYIITNASELNAMHNNLSAYYRLGNDIDLSSSLIWNYGRGWEPVGSEDEGNNFTGTLDGYGFTLTGITVNRPLSDEMGLFGYMNGAEIKNISFENTHIAANDYAGTIAGKSENSYFSFINVGANIAIRDDYAGGISGYSTTDLMHYLSADINIFGSAYLGGIAGDFRNGSEIRHSFSKGTIQGSGSNNGGIFGNTYGYSTLISDCFSYADVSGTTNIGGLIGYHQTASVYRSFSYGAVTGTGSSVGGLIGGANGSTYYSYWDTETSGQETSAGGTGKTTSEMQQIATYPQFNFIYLWTIDENNSYPYFRDLSSYSQPEETELSELSGTGTESDPYIITNADELNAMHNNLSAYYRLGNNIDLSSSIIWNYGRGLEAIGSEDEGNNFTGGLDGTGYTITGLHINRPISQYQGLFGYSNNAIFSNINFDKSFILSDAKSGTLIGFALQTNIKNITINTHIVSSKSEIGGLAGIVQQGSIMSAYSDSDIFGYNYLGGLVGYFGYEYYNNGSQMRYCSSSGNIFGYSHLGGLIGKTYNENSIIADSYSSVDVTGTTYLGGLIGEHQVASVYRSFSYGSVSGEGSSVGGLIGNANGQTYYSYWDTETSGQETSAGGTGKTTSEMQQIATYPQFNFNYLWTIDENNSYPYFRDLSVYALPETIELSSLDGAGTEEDPYIITDANELNTMRNDLTAYYKLGNDIDLSSSIIWNYGAGWEPVGKSDSLETHFSGTFDGDGHTIKGMHISRARSSYQGLFGVTSNAIIKNLKIATADLLGYKKIGTIAGYSRTTEIHNSDVTTNIISSNNEIGGIAGMVFEGGIYNSYADVNIYANTYAGGIAGYLGEGYYNDGSDLHNSFTTGNIHGYSNIGGLVGKTYNGATSIENCFSRANVYAVSTSGGALGYHQVATMKNSYTTGYVDGDASSLGGMVGGANGSTIKSYWDTETSGKTTSSGGAGRTTENMVYPYSGVVYEDWDFVNTWSHDLDGDINDGYPYLQGFDDILFVDAPTLNSPEDESTDVVLNPTLTWNSINNATNYILEFASDDAFNNIIETADITASNYQINDLPYNTEYFWRVKAYNAFNESEWSEVWSFTTYSFDSMMPVLAGPADETTNILFGQEFSWEYLQDVDSYEIQVSSSLDFYQHSISK
jgi:hypothetical protein